MTLTDTDFLVVLLVSFAGSALGVLVGMPMGHAIGLCLAERERWREWRRGQ